MPPKKHQPRQSRRKRGRPISEDGPRNDRLALRLTDEERERIEAAAKADSRELSTFVRLAALEKAAIICGK